MPYLKRKCILNCPPGERLHSFPKDEAGRNVWIKKLGIKRARRSSFLCDRHFSEKMRPRGLPNMKINTWAIPDLNLPEPVEDEQLGDDIIELDDEDDNIAEDDYSEETPTNGYSTNYVESSKNDNLMDFDEVLAQKHCISDITKETPVDGDECVGALDEDEIDLIEECSSPERDLTNYADENSEKETTITASPVPVEINSKFKRKLIASVRKRRILYDPAHPLFSNIAKKTRAWGRIGKIQKVDGSACRELWLQMRYDYQNHVRKLRKWLSGESYSRDRPRIPFENDLLFLWRYIPDKSHCDDTDEEEELCQPRSVISHIPGIPEASNFSKKDVSAIVSNYARAVDHPYATNKPDESIQFACNLIEVVRFYPELYDPLHPNYGDPKRKSIIWDAVSNELNEKATKCLYTWLLLQMRYEFEIINKKSSYLVNKMDFLNKFILSNAKSPLKRATLAIDQWFEPMNGLKEQHRILQTIVSMKRYRPFFANIDVPAGSNKEPQLPCWLAVARLLKRKPQQCEITWILMQAMYSELNQMRKKGFTLRDEWEFESVIKELLENIEKKTKKYNKDPAPSDSRAIHKTTSTSNSTITSNTSMNADSSYCFDADANFEPTNESLMPPPPAPPPPPDPSLNEITFFMPGATPDDDVEVGRFRLDVPVKELPEKSIVDIGSVLPNAHLVIINRYRKVPTVFLFTLEKRKEFIAEVMARPILFNQPCKFSRLSRIFWGEVSVEIGFPVEICMYFWEHVMEKKFYMEYDPSCRKSNEPKWIPPPNPIFDKFQKYANSKDWGEYISVLPDFIQEISNFPLIYMDLKINSSWNRRQCHSRDIAEVWTILSRKYAVLENHKVIWDKFKQVFLQYMSEMQINLYNAWPKFWAPVLAKMKFLCDLRYDPQDPIYYVIHNQIDIEIRDSKPDGAPIVPKLGPASNAKAIFHLLKENEYCDDFTWVNQARFVAKLKSFPMLYDISHPLFGDKNAKLEAWQEMALLFHCTVGECHMLFQHLMKGFLMFRARDPNQVCRVNAKYWENMTYIYSCAVPNAIDPKSMEGRSFRANSHGSMIKLAEEYQAEISLVDAKPRLILKNFAAAVNSLPIQIQTSMVQQIKYIFAEYTRLQGDDIVVDV